MNEHRQIDSLHAEQASAWLEILRHPTAAQRSAFVAWLKESPRNVHEFLSMYALDQALGQFDAGHQHDVQSLISQADARVVHVSDRFVRFPRTRINRSVWRRFALAAGVVVLALGLIFFAQRHDGWEELRTVSGEQRAFGLEDGSIIYLNTRSRVTIRFAKGSRDVKLLEGEALFKVHHDPSAPFRVYAGSAVIQAVGTQFDVYAHPDGTKVSVIEGLVRVKADAGTSSASTGGSATNGLPREATASFDLAASQVAHIDLAGDVSVEKVADVADSIAWRERRLIFRDDSLAAIVEEFNRYNREQISLANREIGTRTYTGVFDADDPESFIEVLVQDADLTVSRSGMSIVVGTKDAATSQ